MSTNIAIDVNQEFCLVVFDIPDRPKESIRYLRGTIKLSTYDGIAPGEPVAAAGPSVEFILDKTEAGTTLFKCGVIPNTQMRTEDDPRLYANFVALPDTDKVVAKGQVVEVIGKIEQAKSKLGVALGSQLADVPGKIKDAREILTSALDQLDKMVR